MTSTIEALQNLYVARGGELSAVANLVTIPDMINALATLEVANKAATNSDSTDTTDNTEPTSSDNEGGN